MVEALTCETMAEAEGLARKVLGRYDRRPNEGEVQWLSLVIRTATAYPADLALDQTIEKLANLKPAQFCETVMWVFPAQSEEVEVLSALFHQQLPNIFEWQAKEAARSVSRWMEPAEPTVAFKPEVKLEGEFEPQAWGFGL
jgi:hypothetical protein